MTKGKEVNEGEENAGERAKLGKMMPDGEVGKRKRK